MFKSIHPSSSPVSSQRGAATVVTLTLVGLFLGTVVWLLFFVFGKIVPPGYVGVRQSYYSFFGALEKGVANRSLDPGLHWRIPYLSDVILLPSGFQLVHFNSGQLEGELNRPALQVTTKDGSKVATDVTLVVRYFHQPSGPNEKSEELPLDKEPKSVPLALPLNRAHGGPRDLILSYRIGLQEQLGLVAKAAEDELRQRLSGLSNTEFYKAPFRERSVLAAQERINSVINPFGVENWATLVRRYAYAENIDKQIFEKNLQEVTERLNAAASKRESARAKTAQAEALGSATIRDLQVQTEADVQVIRSEGALYQQKKVADGDLLVASARAEVDTAKANALHEIAGSDVYIAREMAPLVGSLRGGIVTGIDPYDIDRWVQKLTSRRSEGGGR